MTDTIDTTTPSYSPAARMAAAMAAFDEPEPAPTPEAAAESPSEQPPTESAPAATPDPSKVSAPDPFDPAELRRIAQERAAARAASAAKTPQAPAQPAMDLSPLVDAMSRPASEKAALEHLKATGDVSKLAEVLGTDAGTLTERILREGLHPGTVSVQTELEAANAKIAALEARLTGDDRQVLTREDLDSQMADWRHQQYQADLNNQFVALSKDKERFPLQAAISDEIRSTLALKADDLLLQARGDRYSITADDIAQVVERDLQSLAQALAGQPTTDASTTRAGASTAAAGQAPSDSNRVQTLSNSRASESVTAQSDPYDMLARRKRALAALAQ